MGPGLPVDWGVDVVDDGVMVEVGCTVVLVAMVDETVIKLVDSESIKSGVHTELIDINMEELMTSVDLPGKRITLIESRGVAGRRILVCLWSPPTLPILVV